MNNHEIEYYKNNNNHVYEDKNKTVKYNAFGPFIRSLFNTVLDVKNERLLLMIMEVVN